MRNKRARPLAKSGFQPIFDGTSLKGWDGDTAFWKAVDGAIVGESTPDNAVKENTFLIWRGGEPRDNFTGQTYDERGRGFLAMRGQAVYVPDGGARPRVIDRLAA